MAEEFSCWQRYGGNLSNKASAPEEPDASSIGWGAGTDVVAMSSTQGTDQGWRWFKDPRIDLLGYRGIFPSNSERKYFHLTIVFIMFMNHADIELIPKCNFLVLSNFLLTLNGKCIH